MERKKIIKEIANKAIDDLMDIEKKEIIVKVVEQIRMENVEMITRVLTEDEDKLKNKPNELVALVETKNIKKNNKRLDKILEINEL